jgi:hypothetical protein
LFVETGKAYLRAVRNVSRERPDIKFDGTVVIPLDNLSQGNLRRKRSGEFRVCSLALPDDRIGSVPHEGGAAGVSCKKLQWWNVFSPD